MSRSRPPREHHSTGQRFGPRVGCVLWRRQIPASKRLQRLPRSPRAILNAQRPIRRQRRVVPVRGIKMKLAITPNDNQTNEKIF